MKRIITNYTCILMLLLTAVTGCKDEFLDVTPKGMLLATTVTDYDKLFNNLSLINTISASNTYPNAQLVMGDEVVTIDPYYAAAAVRTQRLFRWDATVYDADQEAWEMGGIMQQLYTYNKIAAEVMNASGGTIEQKNAVRAEALSNRAWCYLMLINYYGKPYNAATAATDPGYPKVTEADVTLTNFTRASVQEIYDLMVSDLTTAIAYLPVNSGGRVRMCKAAAETLLGKVYLFMGKYNEALVQLNNAFTDLPTSFTVALYNLNTTLAPGGTWGYNATTTPISALSGIPTAWNLNENLFAKQTNASTWNQTSSELLMSPATAALYTASDMRLNYTSPVPNGGGTYGIAGVRRRNTGTQVQIGIRLAELYLMKAECEARVGTVANAISTLETFRKTRMSAADATVTLTDRDPLTRFVIEERLREFALQGYRWFDMRRLSTDPLFSSQVYTHTYYNATGGVAATYTLDSKRLTMRLPQVAITQNPGMENNP